MGTLRWLGPVERMTGERNARRIYRIEYSRSCQGPRVEDMARSTVRNQSNYGVPNNKLYLRTYLLSYLTLFTLVFSLMC